MKILLVEDDPQTSEFLAATLTNHRYAVDTIADGAAGLDLAARWQYDLILLDILLPTLDGIEVCRQLRVQGCQTPILILTMKDTNEDVIAGLDAGADDYVPKSCDPAQLLARVRALLRRGSNAASSPILTWGQLCLNPASAQVTYHEKEISLRPKEYSLLELLLRNPQRILSRSAIIDHLWSMEETPVEGSVTNLIKDLRQRLKSAGMKADLIETVYGLGYRSKPAPSSDSTLENVENNPLDTTVSDRDAAWQARQQRGLLAIEQIKERFQSSLEQRITALEAIERSLQQGNLNLQQRRAAQREVHNLAGGLGTFSCAKASEIARVMEQLLETEADQKPQLANRFSSLMQDLKQELGLPGSYATSKPREESVLF
ncbi:response regulator [Leptolyngbya ohadii]|uniref:response regulator n=1 Tax=Leptolyngbya ohadii TaxID=1962290 RepID=UPI000B59D10B|nr:response regulator [Leptolyngbya ohadii]